MLDNIVFVWTIQDVVGVVLLSIVLLIVGVAMLQDWWTARKRKW